MSKADDKKRAGFTLIELLLVMAIIGLLLALIIPRAQRAQLDAKFAEVRQCGSEIAAAIMTWAEDKARNQVGRTNYTTRDFLYTDIESTDPGFTSYKLSGKYTGNEAFAGVKSLLPVEQRPKNPFNFVDYFASVNDDQVVRDEAVVYEKYEVPIPSKKPGLLFLTAQPDPLLKEYLNFYLLYTATVAVDAERGSWYGAMDHETYEGLRHGIFVARLYDDQEDGGREENLIDWQRRQTGR
ncbi:MAG: prepilin-type N-terminal cleavage/methylation domain-containing protein [Deltaproteobacteria bacterium]|nr:prepilin-type N-terminal cleavage/methylation domain-containing protein [Deltaproteobacteria bacterium]